MLDLKSVYAKLGRAEEHFELLKGEIGPWTEKCSYHLPLAHNPQFTEHRLIAQQLGPAPDLLRWSLMIGDCVTNLRVQPGSPHLRSSEA